MDVVTALCTVKGCPAPRDPDFHIPICGHGLEGHHHHVTKRSQGGKDGPQVFICPDCHHNIDNGLWGNAVHETFEDGKRVTMFRAWDLHNKTVIEQVIGIDSSPSAKEEDDGTVRRGLDTDVPSSIGDATGGGVGEPTKTGSPNKPVAASGDNAPNDSQHHPIYHPNPLTHEQRVAKAQEIKDAEWNRQWIAGDTGNAWIAELGESAEQYLSDFGYQPETLANILRVCAKIPKRLRGYNLRFSHFVVVADQDLESIEMWLDKCEEEQWSVAEFRRQVKGTKARVKRWTLEELRQLADDWYGDDRAVEFLDWLGER